MNGKLLVIDDDRIIREIVSISLEDDWNVVIAGSGAEGLKLAQSENPDVILLDMMMPGQDGISTLKQLRENPSTSNIPVVFLTAKVQAQEVESYSGMDVIGVLSKPFDPMTLADEVHTLLKEHRVGL